MQRIKDLFSRASKSVSSVATGGSECFIVIPQKDATSLTVIKEATDSGWSIATVANLESAIAAGFVSIAWSFYDEKSSILSKVAIVPPNDISKEESMKQFSKKCIGDKCYYYTNTPFKSPSSKIDSQNYGYIAYGKKPKYTKALDYHIFPFNGKKWSMYDKDA